MYGHLANKKKMERFRKNICNNHPKVYPLKKKIKKKR